MPAVFAPVVEAQTLVPPVPVIVQVKLPVGAAAWRDPVTVAVINSFPPKVGAEGVATKVTVGVASPTTVVVLDEVSVTGLYEESPVKMKLAP